MTSATSTRPGRDHVVTFYERDDELAVDVARFLAEGIDAGGAAIVVATPEHRRAIEADLRERGLPVDRLRAEGRLAWPDAEETLASLMDGEAPDRERFRRVVGHLVAGAAVGGRAVWAFGEMVGLLWERGAVTAAVDLESLWNELCADQDLSLYCAYPAPSLAEADLTLVHDVCLRHSEVLPPACYAPDGSEAGATTSRSRLFLPMPIAARAVRRFVGETLEAWGAAALFDDATLVASELTTNVVRHASSPFRVTLRLDDDAVAIAVHDTSPAAPRARRSTVDAVNGRGLAIVAELSSRWGTESRADGKVVWATLPRPA